MDVTPKASNGNQNEWWVRKEKSVTIAEPAEVQPHALNDNQDESKTNNNKSMVVAGKNKRVNFDSNANKSWWVWEENSITKAEPAKVLPNASNGNQNEPNANNIKSIVVAGKNKRVNQHDANTNKSWWMWEEKSFTKAEPAKVLPNASDDNQNEFNANNNKSMVVAGKNKRVNQNGANANNSWWMWEEKSVAKAEHAAALPNASDDNQNESNANSNKSMVVADNDKRVNRNGANANNSWWMWEEKSVTKAEHAEVLPNASNDNQNESSNNKSMVVAVKNKRVTMIKPTVGKVKSSSYPLPDNDFVYGIENKFDKEGAGKVVQGWAQSEPSKPPCSMQSFPATNRQALKNGCLTSKAQREYGKKFPVMKQNPKQSARGQANNNAASSTSCPPSSTGGVECPNDSSGTNAENGQAMPAQQNNESQSQTVFGIQSEKNKAPMTELLRGIPSTEESDYPDLSGQKRKGRLPPAKSTKSSLMMAKCREPPSEEEAAAQKKVEEFKMKKFLKVQSKVKCHIDKGMEL